MSLKITRVQLNGYPTADQYEALHSRMEYAVFGRSILSSRGIRYHLPHGEYVSEHSMSTEEVCSLAHRTADSAYPGKVSVLTTEGNNVNWNGLDPA